MLRGINARRKVNFNERHLSEGNLNSYEGENLIGAVANGIWADSPWDSLLGRVVHLRLKSLIFHSTVSLWLFA